jgi:hypothetical protein
VWLVLFAALSPHFRRLRLPAAAFSHPRGGTPTGCFGRRSPPRYCV